MKVLHVKVHHVKVEKTHKKKEHHLLKKPTFHAVTKKVVKPVAAKHGKVDIKLHKLKESATVKTLKGGKPVTIKGAVKSKSGAKVNAKTGKVTAKQTPTGATALASTAAAVMASVYLLF